MSRQQQILSFATKRKEFHDVAIREYDRKYFEDKKRKLDEGNMKILRSNPMLREMEKTSRPIRIDELTKTKKGKGTPYRHGSILSHKTKSIRRTLNLN
jgi:hypothetical protein